MTEITNLVSSAEVKYTDDTYTMTGDFKQDPETGEVLTINLSAEKNAPEPASESAPRAAGTYVGNINAFTEGGELKLNMNNAPLSETAGIAQAVIALIAEIKAN